MSDDAEPWAPPIPVPQGGQPAPPTKRGLYAGGAILAAVAVAVVMLMLTGEDEGGADTEADLAAWIEGRTGVASDAAACVADLMVDEVGADAFEGADFDASEPPPEVVAAALDVGLGSFLDECGVDDLFFGGDDSGDITDSTDDTFDTTDDGPTPTFDEATTADQLASACLDGDFAACDQLYIQSPIDSDYEELGSTCGGIAEPQLGFCETTNGGQDDSGSGVGDDSGADFG